MAIIVSSFKGSGCDYFTADNKDKVKVLDKRGQIGDNEIDEIMNVIGEYDIIFVDSNSNTRRLLEERNIDFDVFYPSKGRRREYIENQVKKHAPSKEIQELDRYFDERVDEIDSDESENCHKHKMEEYGHFLGNDAIIMQYIKSLK